MKKHHRTSYTVLALLLTALLAACGSDMAQSPADELSAAGSKTQFLFQSKENGNSSHAILHSLITPFPKGLIGGLPVDNTFGATVQMYACVAGGTDNFVSPDSNCEGRERLGYYDFLLYKKGGKNRLPVYRCTTGGDHYLNRFGCGNNTNEGVLGYAAKVKINIDPFYYFYF